MEERVLTSRVCWQGWLRHGWPTWQGRYSAFLAIFIYVCAWWLQIKVLELNVRITHCFTVFKIEEKQKWVVVEKVVSTATLKEPSGHQKSAWYFSTEDGLLIEQTLLHSRFHTPIYAHLACNPSGHVSSSNPSSLILKITSQIPVSK